MTIVIYSAYIIVSIVMALAFAGWVYSAFRYHQIMESKRRHDREMVQEYEAQLKARNAKNGNAE